MKSLLLYSNSTHRTGKRLGEVLELDAVRMESKPRGTTHLIRWGNSQFPSFDYDCAVLNKAQAIADTVNREHVFRRCNDSGCRVPQWSRNCGPTWHRSPEADPYYVAEGNDPEWLWRTRYGARGRDIHALVRGTEIPDILGGMVVKYMRADHEVRVHIMHGKSIGMQLKYHPAGELAAQNHPIIRSRTNGWRMKMLAKRLAGELNINRQKVRDLAKKAARTLGLHFAAVDILVKGTNVWLLEINTGPGLGHAEAMERRYVKAMRQWLTDTPVTEETDEPEEGETLMETLNRTEPPPAPTFNFDVPTHQVPGFGSLPRSGTETLILDEPASRYRTLSEVLTSIEVTDVALSSGKIFTCLPLMRVATRRMAFYAIGIEDAGELIARYHSIITGGGSCPLHYYSTDHMHGPGVNCDMCEQMGLELNFHIRDGIGAANEAAVRRYMAQSSTGSYLLVSVDSDDEADEMHPIWMGVEPTG